MSGVFYELKEQFNRDHDYIMNMVTEIKGTSRSTMIMATTWKVKQILDRMQHCLDECYIDGMTKNEYNNLDKFIEDLNDSIWEMLYDIAQNIERR